MKKYLLMMAIACLIQQVVQAQTDTSIHHPLAVSRIIIKGNKKTKPYIILRELSFKEGDTLYLPDLISKFDRARDQLYNTRLFNDVVIFVKGFYGYTVQVEIEVKERWYIFPLPYFKPVDRNLSAWADNGYKLSRANYGAKFSYYNVTGRNDKLKLWLLAGYTPQIQASYEQPYADKTLKHGYSLGVVYGANKEVNVLTANNKQVFLNADSITNGPKYLNRQFGFSIGYSYRPGITTRHAVSIGYNYSKIDTAILAVNSKYFSAAKTRISYPSIAYGFVYNKVDYVAYPLKGFYQEASIVKRGFNSDMNVLELSSRSTWGKPIARKMYYGLNGYFNLKLPFDQPYSNLRSLGYRDNYLRGMEKYVIDGVATTTLRNTIRRELVNFNIATHLHSKTHDKVPFKIYLKAFGDAGYVYNKTFIDNSLVNRMLYTAGTGVDIVTLYDVVVRFEYSFNQLGENGLFLHFTNEF